MGEQAGGDGDVTPCRALTATHSPSRLEATISGINAEIEKYKGPARPLKYGAREGFVTWSKNMRARNVHEDSLITIGNVSIRF